MKTTQKDYSSSQYLQFNAHTITEGDRINNFDVVLETLTRTFYDPGLRIK